MKINYFIEKFGEPEARIYELEVNVMDERLIKNLEGFKEFMRESLVEWFNNAKVTII